MALGNNGFWIVVEISPDTGVPKAAAMCPKEDQRAAARFYTAALAYHWIDRQPPSPLGYMRFPVEIKG